MKITITSATFYQVDTKDMVDASLSIHVNNQVIETVLTLDVKDYDSNGNFSVELLEGIEGFKENLELEQQAMAELLAEQELLEQQAQILAEQNALEQKEQFDKLIAESVAKALENINNKKD